MAKREFISDVSGQSFYISPVIAPFSIRKYNAGINTTNGAFEQLRDGAFFIMSRVVDSDVTKKKLYFIKDNQGNFDIKFIDADSGEMDGFIIDGGTWS